MKCCKAAHVILDFGVNGLATYQTRLVLGRIFPVFYGRVGKMDGLRISSIGVQSIIIPFLGSAVPAKTSRAIPAAIRRRFGSCCFSDESMDSLKLSRSVFLSDGTIQFSLQVCNITPISDMFSDQNLSIGKHSLL